MSYDWNSFFGTFAQISGALVGIIAAFLISKLIGLGERSELLSEEFEKLTIKYSSIKHALSHRYFRWYNERQIEQSSFLENVIDSGEITSKSKDDILKILYENIGLYKDDDNVYEKYCELVEELKPKGSFGLDRITRKIVVRPELYERIADEREKIGELAVETHKLIKEFQGNRMALISFANSLKPLFIIMCTLLIAFPLTVLYPLHFLPLAENMEPNISILPHDIFIFWFSLKGFFLLLFFLIFEGVFVYFLMLIYNVRSTSLKIVNQHKDEFYNIESYSPYLVATSTEEDNAN